MKQWKIQQKLAAGSSQFTVEDVKKILLKNRHVTTKKEVESFLSPPDPNLLNSRDAGIDPHSLKDAVSRIRLAIKTRESIVVYADYDADGITAGTIMWETLHILGAKVMPYIPHRVDEGYGLSVKGIDNVRALHDPSLIITVDHGITAKKKIEYAKSLGIEVIVTDHHVKPEELPDCRIVHTTNLCGAGVSWFLAKELISSQPSVISAKFNIENFKDELLVLACIGTIADMVPLRGVNRAIAKYGLELLKRTRRIGLLALIKAAGLTPSSIDTYSVSHLIAPRLNAMGRLVHALDALRLLCTGQEAKAHVLAQKLNEINRERQDLTIDTTIQAKMVFTADSQKGTLRKLLFVAHESYNPGVIGLVAGKLVEEFYRPSIVVAKGEVVSKASARSILGFNIIELIRSCSDLLVDAGGHPMAAGFTVETTKLVLLKERLEKLTDEQLDVKLLEKTLNIDLYLPLNLVSHALWDQLQSFAPFGIGNPEPVFVSQKVIIRNMRTLGAEGKHLKLNLTTDNSQPITIDAIGFGLGDLYSKLSLSQPIDIAYTIDLNKWNGNEFLQLKLRDIHI